LVRGVCYFFGVIFILGGFFLLFTYSLFLGLGGMIIGIILIAIGHKAGGGEGGGDSGSGGGKRSWGLTEEQKKRAQQHWWYFNIGPGKKR
jgi:hypothetical protein